MWCGAAVKVSLDVGGSAAFSRNEELSRIGHDFNMQICFGAGDSYHVM